MEVNKKNPQVHFYKFWVAFYWKIFKPMQTKIAV